MTSCTMMDAAILIVAASIGTPIAVYLVVRMAAAAWFNARKHYERSKL